MGLGVVALGYTVFQLVTQKPAPKKKAIPKTVEVPKRGPTKRKIPKTVEVPA